MERKEVGHGVGQVGKIGFSELKLGSIGRHKRKNTRRYNGKMRKLFGGWEFGPIR